MYKWSTANAPSERHDCVIVLLHDRGLRNGKQAKAVHELGAAGVGVTVSTLDIEVPEEARQLVALCARAKPLGGVFHLAMVLDDNLIANQV